MSSSKAIRADSSLSTLLSRYFVNTALLFLNIPSTNFPFSVTQVVGVIHDLATQVVRVIHEVATQVVRVMHDLATQVVRAILTHTRFGHTSS